MADVAIDLESTDFNEVYSGGIRAYVLQDFESASAAFSRATEILIQQHDGDDLHDSLGDVYLYYAKSLLQLSRKQDKPLNDDALNQKDDTTSDSDQDDGSDQKEEEKNGDSPKKPVAVEGNGTVEDAPSTSTVHDDVEQTSQTEEDISDLQVAWEVLEFAKKIFTKQAEAGRKNLSECLITLGEVSLESNMINEGIEDLKQGLQIQESIYEDDSRVVATSCYEIGMALASNNQYDTAVGYFEKCLKYLENRLKNLTQKIDESGNKEEIEEIKGLLPDINETLMEVKNIHTEVSQEIAKLMGIRPMSSEKEAVAKDGASTSSASTNQKPVNDISHLVKRKRQIEPEPTDENPPTKKSTT